MIFDKNKIKESITIEMTEEILAHFGAEPERVNDTTLICQTICHNIPGEGSRKLYYYQNDDMGIFNCYTSCGSMDIFELVQKVFELRGEEITLYNAQAYVINFFSLDFERDFYKDTPISTDWKYFEKWGKSQLSTDNEKVVELKVYDDKVLKNLPKPHYLNWEREGITKEVCDHRGICYDPGAHGIVIPHYDIDGNLVGIRERTLVKENEVYGKYRPAILNKKMYNHPLGYNLYNLNFSKENISQIKKAIIFESEKSCLKMASMFGESGDISVACCGSNLLSYQVQLLLSLGVDEIIIAFDRQYQDVGDKEWKQWTKKLTKLHDKYGAYVQISYMFDKKHLLGYKDSPIDRDKDTFMTLWKNRIII